jgi:hypothetical protein
MVEDKSADNQETRQSRREEKLRKRRERLAKHGKGLAQMYRDVVLKRFKGK